MTDAYIRITVVGDSYTAECRICPEPVTLESGNALEQHLKEKHATATAFPLKIAVDMATKVQTVSLSDLALNHNYWLEAE